MQERTFGDKASYLESGPLKLNEQIFIIHSESHRRPGGDHASCHPFGTADFYNLSVEKNNTGCINPIILTLLHHFPMQNGYSETIVLEITTTARAPVGAVVFVENIYFSINYI